MHLCDAYMKNYIFCRIWDYVLYVLYAWGKYVYMFYSANLNLWSSIEVPCVCNIYVVVVNLCI